MCNGCAGEMRAEQLDEAGRRCVFGRCRRGYAYVLDGQQYCDRHYRIALVRAARDGVSERLAALREAFDAMVVVTQQGQPCYRTSNGIPQGMPQKVERKVRRALKLLARGGEPPKGAQRDE